MGAHLLSAGGLSILHAFCMLSVRMALWPGSTIPAWKSYLQRVYLMNLDWVLMTYSAIVGLSYALAYYREAQVRQIKAAHLETRLVEARLKTLEAELHPHFLFNTLHAISTLVHSNPDSADRMISRLSDLLRITFDRAGAARVSLQEEIEFLQKYLEIEQTRFQDRLHVSYEIDPDTLDAEVPRLILQPLVENAIKHGVSPRTGPGAVRIASNRQGEALLLEVHDDGVGLTGGARAALSSGVGLSNTRARLECLYGGAHALEFSEEPDGLAVRLRIPFHRVPSGSDEAASRVA
jgi:LytS/YehU family sensor histidine kinase